MAGPVSQYFQVLGLLIKKNVKLTTRDYISLTIQVLIPLFVTLILFLSQRSFDSGLGFAPEALEERDPPIEPLGIIPSCSSLVENDQGETQQCQMVYVDSGYEPVQRWVTDLAALSGINSAEIVRQENSTAVNEYLLNNKNITLAAVIFEDSDVEALRMNDISFVLQYNQTSQFQFPLGSTRFNDDFVLPSMTVSLTSIIMQDILNRPVNIRLSKRAFPHPNLAVAGDALETYGSLLLFGAYTVTMIFFLTKIVTEKEKHLREAMRMAGMQQSQHFLSWGIVFFAVMTATSLLLIVFGYIFQFPFYLETNFGIIFLSFMIFGYALVAWSFFLSTIIRQSSTVNNVSFVFYTVSYIIASTQSIIYGFSTDGEPFITATYLRQVFAFLPPTMFGRCIETIAAASKLGNGLEWKDIKGREGDPTNIFPIQTCWLWMFFTSAIIFLLAMYLDNVLPGGFGKKLPVYYFLTWSYWRSQKAPVDEILNVPDAEALPPQYEEVQPQASLTGGIADDEEDADIKKERENIINGSKNASNCAVVIKGMTKRYGSLRAVNNVYMSIAHGSLFCLLGHNGAGKSTLFSMLTGVTSVSSGDAEIYGRSVRNEQESIRSILGVCPQHDILWDSLTCAEHIELYAGLKGVPKERRKAEVELRLSQVELLDVENKYSSQLSGGMQRRLSVAISLTGDPRIVFLDEPTTGMDPVSRRQVWSMIEAAKKGRVIVLVTHSMEEADVLGDNVAIMARGMMRVLGSPLYLKSKFGAGYKLIALSSSVQTTSSAIASMSPDSQMVETNVTPSGAFIAEYTIPRSDTSRLRSIIQSIEQQMASIGVLSFSISESTLEEVFLKITGLWVDEGDMPSDKKGCCSCC